MRLLNPSLCAVTLGALLGTSPASAREQLSVDVAAGVSAATNPFLQRGNDTEAFSGFLEIVPRLTSEDEISQISLQGRAQLAQYSNGFGFVHSGEVDLKVFRQQTDRLTLTAGASFQTDRGAVSDVLSRPSFTVQPVPGIVQPIDDLSFIGRRTRTTSATARVGAGYRLSDRESLDVNAGVGAYRFNDPLLFDYRFANQEVGYSREVSTRTSLRGSIGFGQVDYLNRRIGDSLIVTPLLGVTQQLSGNSRATLAVGPSFTRLRLVDGSRDSRTSFAVRASYCANQARGSFCFNLDRASQPTAQSNVDTLTAFRFIGNRRLNDRDSVHLSANASRTGSGNGVTSGKRWFVGASGELARQFNPRFSTFARASFADIYDDVFSRRADVRGELGVRYRFGALR